jgi:hypothetical protein
MALGDSRKAAGARGICGLSWAGRSAPTHGRVAPRDDGTDLMWFPQPGRNFFTFANEVVKQLVAKHMKRVNDSGLSQNRVGGEPFLISLE